VGAQDLKVKLSNVNPALVEDLLLAMAVKVQADADFKDTLDKINDRINGVC